MSDLARRLADAVRTVTPLDPSSSGLSPEDAYEVQDEVISELGGAIEAVKLGLTSRAKQEQMGVAEPLYGWFMAGSQIEPGVALHRQELIQPRIEPEIAFRLGAELKGGSVSTHDVLAATAAVMPALDVLDSRYAGYKFTLPDVIADNASAARYAVGDPVPVDGIDLARVGGVFTQNGRLVATAAGAAIMDHPAAAVAWLVRKLAEKGRGLAAGSLVLAGALTAAFPAEVGDTFTIEFDRIGQLHLVVR